MSTIEHYLLDLIHVQNGRTALYIASGKGHDQIVELLLKREAGVNHQTKVRPLLLVCVLLHEEWDFKVKNTRLSYMHNMNKAMIMCLQTD